MLIGSQAMKYFFSDFPREPKDIDYISKDSIEGAECKWCDSFEYILNKYPNLEIATPEILYTLKVSHSFWNIHWEKTIFDIEFLQRKGIVLNEELFEILYRDCKKRYGEKQAYLNVKNEDFFTKNVSRKYIHDDLHKAVAYYNEPLFNKIKKDKSLAKVDYDLFLNLTYEDKCNLCREEIYVTALERILIPQDFRSSDKSAFKQATKLLVTSMTKGWFPKFIITNWLNIKNYKYNYLQKFNLALKEGRINYVASK